MYKPHHFEFSISGYLGASYEFVLAGDELICKYYTLRYRQIGEARIRISTRQWDTFRKAMDETRVWE